MRNLANRKFGNFVIETSKDGLPVELGRGAFGVTFLARHTYLDSLAAIKIIRNLKSEIEREKFLREARTAHKLDNPHIARVLDFGEDPEDGTLYYAIAYCSGGSMEALARREKGLAPATVAALAIQLADALGHAHIAGILHRDVKPANVLQAKTSPTLNAQLIDFGIAATLGLTGDGQFKGTPLFASPEQIQGQALDARSDLFSLGMTLWWLLLGHSPLPGDTRQVISRHLAPEGYANAVPESLPPALTSVLVSLLDKSRDGRPPDAYTVVRLLETGGFTSFARINELRNDEAGLQAEQITAEVVGETADVLFEVGNMLHQSGVGSWYEASYKPESRRCLLWLANHALSVEEESALAQEVVALRRARLSSYPKLFAFLRTRDSFAVVFEPSAGESLVSLIRKTGTLALREAVPLLQSLAESIDSNADLPAPFLQPHLIYAEIEGNSLHGTLLPNLLTSADAQPDETADVFATMDVSDSASLPISAQFAGLIYFLSGGRAVASAAFFTREAYSPIPQLGEASNRLLAGLIAGESSSITCTAILGEIMQMEGAGSTGSISVSRSTTFIPEPVPPIVEKPRESTAKSHDLSTPSQVSASPIEPLRSPDHKAAETIPKKAATGTQVVPPSKISSRTLLLLVAVVTIIALEIGWLTYIRKNEQPAPKSGGTELPDSISPRDLSRKRIEHVLSSAQRADEARLLLSRYVESYGRDDFTKKAEKQLAKSTKAEQKRGVILVPSDGSLLDAASRVQPDQVIELAPGEYQCEITLLSNVVLRAATPGTVTLLQSSLQAPAITLRDGANVRLEGMTIRGIEGGENVALMVASDASLYLKNSTVVGAPGNGITAEGQSATIEMQDAEVSGCGGNGIEIRNGASVIGRGSRITENSRSGLYLAASGCSADLDQGSVFAKNQVCGIQASGNADIRILNSTFKANGSAGIFVSGAGSSLRLARTNVSDTRKTGVKVGEGAIATIENSTLKDNGEDGIYFEKASAESTVTNCMIDSNGRLGVFIDGSTAPGDGLIVKNNTVQSNATAGIAFVEASPSVTGNQLFSNGIGVLAMKGSGGVVSGNRIRVRGGQDDIIVENGATTTVANDNAREKIP